MPYTNVPPEKKDLMDKCVSEVEAQGHDQQGAIAICYASIVEGKAFPDGVKFEMPEVMKIGARNNSGDKQRITESKAHAQAILDHMSAMQPDPNPEDKPPMKAGLVDLPIEILQLVTVKAGAEAWTLDVLGVPFGGPFNGRDRDKQYFDASTKTFQDVYKSIPAVYGHGLTPDGKVSAKPEIVGTAQYDHTDAKGHWYKVFLDKASALAARLWDAAKAGKARASSGSISHMVRIDPNGHIAEWPVAEMTLVDEGTSNLIPSNPYAVAMPALKASYEAAGMKLPIENQPEATPPGDEHAGAADKPKPIIEPKKGLTMPTPEEMAIFTKMLDDRDAAKASADSVKAEAARIKAIEDENKSLKDAAAKANRLPGGMPLVSQYADTYKYDHLSAADLALALDVQSNIAGTRKMPAPSAAAIKALALKIARIEQDKVSVETAQYVKAEIGRAHV